MQLCTFDVREGRDARQVLNKDGALVIFFPAPETGVHGERVQMIACRTTPSANLGGFVEEHFCQRARKDNRWWIVQQNTGSYRAPGKITKICR